MVSGIKPYLWRPISFSILIRKPEREGRYDSGGTLNEMSHVFSMLGFRFEAEKS
jgi:hypothetical protein